MVIRCVSAVMFALVSFCLLTAQEVRVPAKVTGEPGELLSIRVQWEGSEVRYLTTPGLSVFREYDPDPKVLALRAFAKEAGVYSITLIASSPTGKLSEFTPVSIVIANTAPQPPPVPPVPKAATCWVIVVEQAGEARTPALAKILTDRSLWKSVEDAGSQWAVLSSEDPAAIRGGYAKAGDKVGFPALLLVSDEGKPLLVRPLKTADDIKNALKEVTGK